ncbi:MAG: hypothetical protein HY330_07780 [Chloroflexi bacterium]|nr:hypothetical protein [Chloroflexota bacterium]
MPRLALPLKPTLQALKRFKPPKPPSLEEVAKRAEEAFIRFNQGPCVDGKAHVFKTQPFPPYAREFCAKCGVDKDDLATYREGLRTYHGVGDRLWSGLSVAVSAPAAAGAATAAATPRRRSGLIVPLTLGAGLILLAIGIAMIWPPLANSGAGMFFALMGFAASIVASIIWATGGSAKSRHGP